METADVARSAGSLTLHSSLHASASTVAHSLVTDPTVAITIGVAVLVAHLSVLRAISPASFLPASLTGASASDDGPSSSASRGHADDPTPVFTTVTQAVMLPISAGGALVILYFFSNLIGPLLITLAAASAGVSFAFALWPVTRKTPNQLLPAFASAVVLVWLYTGHWALNDVLTACACIMVVSLLRLPDLRTTTILLVGLVAYDVFFVFFAGKLIQKASGSSTAEDAASVMVAVATSTPRNPLALIVSWLRLGRFLRPVNDLALPAKFVIPSFRSGAKAGEYCILGAGDVIMPALALVYLRGVDLQWRESKRPAGVTSTYYVVALFMYFLSLVMTFFINGITASAQPALLYIVPFVLGGAVVGACLRGELGAVWRGERVVPADGDEEQTLLTGTI
jgi:signal peptide peptidase-like 3